MGDAANWATVDVERERGVAWVVMSRADKRNAMNPRLNVEMQEVLQEIADDDECSVVVLTGRGDAYSAGMDLKECFRDLETASERDRRRIRHDAGNWQWRMLRTYPKPTIAMVNGWCFGAALTTVMACDLAIAADEAVFGVTEVKWGMPPGGVLARSLVEMVGSRNAMYHIMTGRPFDGRRAAEMGLVNSSVPLGRLREEVQTLASELAELDPRALRAAKIGAKHVVGMSWDQAEDYLYAKVDQAQLPDSAGTRLQGLGEFLDTNTAATEVGDGTHTKLPHRG